MSSKPEIINLTSSTSSSSSSEDLPPYPSEFDDSDYARELERQWNALERGEPSNAPIPAERQYVSPFIFTSDEDSSEDEDEDPTFLPPPHKRDPNPGQGREIHLFQHHGMWCWVFLLQNLVLHTMDTGERARRQRWWVRVKGRWSRR